MAGVDSARNGLSASRVSPKRGERRSPFVLSLAFGGVLSCGGSLPLVPRGQHPLQGGATPVVVDEAPPPAQIDTLKDDNPPKPGCLWADGQYLWKENRWQWQPGSWVKPLPTCYYADPLLVWAPGVDQGVRFYTPGQWYMQDSQAMCPAPPPC